METAPRQLANVPTPHRHGSDFDEKRAPCYLYHTPPLHLDQEEEVESSFLNSCVRYCVFEAAKTIPPWETLFRMQTSERLLLLLPQVRDRMRLWRSVLCVLEALINYQFYIVIACL